MNSAEARVRLVPFTKRYLDRSWTWLSDPEIKSLTLTPDFTREEQQLFFASLSERKDYIIWGVEAASGEAVGASGLKNIVGSVAESWCYIGERSWWGKGVGRQILEECERKAKELRITDLYMKVLPSNTRSIKLYASMDFILDSNRSKDGLLCFRKAGL